ncbi:prohibitin complex subunit 1 [Tribonema minus]|uniref:Prohibitin n=1 Tax=Tribonema minus TaxID=303371 RepID=A0A835Z1F2_9STRA|nr:prohibitin complex subunit 1 [Tribonema minus]|eukprot:TRINITY_DN1245_c0_g1_i4.p1 TRINITY_DN1245_c0_g1~~TRINITY_DN1245_c0_g1_i4.p1  ORF type:complete len:277 (-),score=104.80 TRINITY_DN1245_c0_g1_i4:446-1276(-)
MADRLLSAATRVGVLVAGAAAVDLCLYTVDGGERAVIFDRLAGVKDDVVGEGTHFLIPGLQTPIIMDVRDRARVINSVTGTKDLQTANISLRVLSRPDEAKLALIFKQLGQDYDDRVLPSLGNEVLKAVVAKYNAEELLSKRETVSHQVREEIMARAKQFNLILDDVSITHLTFGREFTKAIENKQVAQQEAERQVYLVQKSEQERQAAVIRAEGEAEAADLISNALKSSGSGLIEVRRIDAAKEIAETLANGRGVTYLPAGQGGANMLLSVDPSH